MSTATPSPIPAHRVRADWPWPGACNTRIYLSTPPDDLTRWVVAAAAVARSGKKVSERTLRRWYQGPSWMLPDRRGVRVEYVPMSRVRMLHRDLLNGSLGTVPPKKPKNRRVQ